MAKPKVFISSTFYDLRQIRADIDQFLRVMGFDTIRNEIGAIPYGRDLPLEDDCIKEVEQCDILISIIGGRFGSETRDKGSIDQYNNPSSISQRELRTAIKHSKQVYIFIDKNVDAEYNTYQLNKNNKDIKYRYVDDNRIYSFIEEVRNLDRNNNIKSFESADEITNYLREQFAGLFQRFLENQSRVKEYNLINELERTSNNLKQLTEFLVSQNKDKQQEIEQILMINHPLINELKQDLRIPYNFYIIGLEDLNALLLARGFKTSIPTISATDRREYYNWKNQKSPTTTETLQIAQDLFDENGKLRNIMANDWHQDNVIYLELTETPPTASFLDDNDLPF